MRRTTLVLAVSLLIPLATAPLSAQPDALANRVDRAVAQTIDAFLVLSNDPGIRAGSFEFPDDVDIDFWRLPFGWTPPRMEPEDGDWNTEYRPYFQGSVGYLVATETGRAGPGFQKSKLKTRSSGATLGGGVHVDINEHWTLSPGLSVAYNQTENDLSGDTTIQAALESFRGRLFDWTIETVSAVPTLETTHFLSPAGDFNTTLSARATYLATWLVSQRDDVTNFQTNSGVFHLQASTEGPLGFAVFNQPLHIRPAIERVQFVGDVEKGLNTNGYFDFKLDVFLDTTDSLPYVSQIGVGGSYSIGDDVTGWSLGLVWKIQY